MSSNEHTLRWRDLVPLKPYEVILDLLLWTPWLLLAWWSILSGNFLLAPIGWFFFFLTGLRLSHEAFHRNLGLPTWSSDLILFLLSPLMLSCLHATRYTHLQHHRFCLGEQDVEGISASFNIFEAIYKGFQYPLLSHKFAWKSNHSFTKSWMIWEIIFIILFYVLGFWILPNLFFSHFLAMIIAECLASFFAVWMVHHDCGDLKNPSRSIRGKWRQYLTYNMFYHYEHHSWPRVPTRNLPRLAQRLDEIGNQKFRKAF
jgi:fatty acid desaturase